MGRVPAAIRPARKKGGTEIMHDMSHMAGPQAAWEYVLVAVAVIIVGWVFYLAFKYTLKPGEEQADHIKRRILEKDDSQPATQDQRGPRKG